MRQAIWDGEADFSKEGIDVDQDAFVRRTTKL